MDNIGRMSEDLPPSGSRVARPVKDKLLTEFRNSASSLARMFTMSSESLDSAYEQGYTDALKMILEAAMLDPDFNPQLWVQARLDRLSVDESAANIDAGAAGRRYIAKEQSENEPPLSTEEKPSGGKRPRIYNSSEMKRSRVR